MSKTKNKKLMKTIEKGKNKLSSLFSSVKIKRVNKRLFTKISNYKLDPDFRAKAAYFHENNAENIEKKQQMNEDIRRVYNKRYENQMQSNDKENQENKQIFEEIKENVDKFITTTCDHFDPADLHNLLSNIESLKICIFKNGGNGDGVLGGYDEDSNEIILYTSDYGRTLPHELFHCATREDPDQSKKGYAKCGFHIKNKKLNWNFGVGLDEGYTELLNTRYFCPDIPSIPDNPVMKLCIENALKKKESYKELKELAKLIEEYFVGEDVMKHFYLTADVVGLIKVLEQSMRTEEALEIIQNMDLLYTATENNNLRKMSELNTDIKNKLKLLNKRLDKNNQKTNKQLVKK